MTGDGAGPEAEGRHGLCEHRGRVGPVMALGPPALAILVVAGQVKGHPALQGIPIDLTLLSAAATLLCIVATRMKLGPGSGAVGLVLVLWLTFIPAIGGIPATSYGETKVLTLFTVTLLLAVAPFQLLREDWQRRSFLTALMWTALIVALTALVFGNSTTASYSDRVILEGSETIGTARIAYMGVIIIYFTGGALVTNRLLRATLLTAGGTLLVLLGILTGSRGPISALVVSALVTAGFCRSFQGRRLRTLVAGLLVGALSFGVARTGSAQDGMGRILGFFEGPDTLELGTRQELWASARSMIVQNPLGNGWGSFGTHTGLTAYPHNLLLEIAAEAGVLSLIVTLFLLVATAVRGVRTAVTRETTALFALFVYSAVNALVSSDVNGARLLMVCTFAIWVFPQDAIPKGRDVREPHVRTSHLTC